MMPSMPPFYYPGAAQPGPGGGYQFPPTQAAPATIQAVAPHSAPDVTSWFCSLDKHSQRNGDGIYFSPYGEILKNKGFIRITQLTLDFVSLKDLQEWLGIEIGTAILIMQYAKEDAEAIKAGTYIFPQ
jgi:hypothetical protein